MAVSEYDVSLLEQQLEFLTKRVERLEEARYAELEQRSRRWWRAFYAVNIAIWLIGAIVATAAITAGVVGN